MLWRVSLMPSWMTLDQLLILCKSELCHLWNEGLDWLISTSSFDLSAQLVFLPLSGEREGWFICHGSRGWSRHRGVMQFVRRQNRASPTWMALSFFHTIDISGDFRDNKPHVLLQNNNSSRTWSWDQQQNLKMSHEVILIAARVAYYQLGLKYSHRLLSLSHQFTRMDDVDPQHSGWSYLGAVFSSVWQQYIACLLCHNANCSLCHYFLKGKQ